VTKKNSPILKRGSDNKLKVGMWAYVLLINLREKSWSQL